MKSMCKGHVVFNLMEKDKEFTPLRVCACVCQNVKGVSALCFKS